MTHRAEAAPTHGGAGWPYPAAQASSVPFASVGIDSLTAKLCFSALIFVTYLGFSPVLTGDYGADGALSGGGDGLRQVGFTALFLLIVAATASGKGARALLDVPLALVAVLLWCWASVAWAIEPGVALRRVLFTTIVTLGVTYSLNMLSYRAAMSILFAWFAAILLLDWLAIPLLAQAVHQPGELDKALVGNWRGIHSHKNEAGAFCALAALVFIDKAWRGRSFITAPVLAVLSLAFLVMTSSKTASGLVLVAALAGIMFDLSYRNPTLRAVAMSTLACGLLLAVVAFGDQAPTLLAVFEDPSSLTGRVQIWPVLLSYAADHLFLGSGYGSFWAIGDASPVYQSGAHWLTTISHAHNGYLDLLVQTGLVGLALAVLGLVVRPMRLLASQPLDPQASRWLLGSMLAFCWLHDLLETSLFDRANIVWVTMLVAFNLLERRAPRLHGWAPVLPGAAQLRNRADDDHAEEGA